MKIIAFASQKGGAGKTTLATHLAVQAERAGAGPVGVIDTDPQGTLAAWRAARRAPAPRFARATPQRLVKEIAAMRDAGVKLLVVDTPPAIGSIIARVVAMADLVVVPSRPSPNDLLAIGATVEITEGLGKPLVFVINGATPRARITADAATALSQHGPVASTTMHQRIAFASSMIDGRAVMEIPGAVRAADEVIQLWSYLSKRLSRNGKDKAAKTAPKRVAKKRPVRERARKPAARKAPTQRRTKRRGAAPAKQSA